MEKFDGESVPSELLKLRIKQKMRDVKSFIVQMEDPEININFMDAI
jgi:hypothetical protein